ncbi:MAG: aspartate carbamoyltransferase regulatory subunit [Spirochaetes bacterium]|nr:MAG: aspartate carbamoyltransferase regulatory subunit [Spirochaetota bacterium]RKY00375.1 MAG: aspartate carbamoyltransferase regulatory subunit [Spirochaetota bacterium]
MKTYKVYAIKDGTVIDHVPATKALKVIDILGLENEGILTIGIGFSSEKMGRKDIIKIENKYLEKEETDKISLIAPLATINIIKNGKLVEKRKIELPDEYINIVKCPNPNCITSKEHVISRFKVINRTPLILRCHYCERIITEDEVEIL